MDIKRIQNNLNTGFKIYGRICSRCNKYYHATTKYSRVCFKCVKSNKHCSRAID